MGSEHVFFRAAAPTVCLLLAACGGGGAGSVQLVPPPPPPAPTAFPLATSASFNSISSDRDYTSPASASNVRLNVLGEGLSMTIRYDAATNSYIVNHTAPSPPGGTGSVSDPNAGAVTLAPSDRTSTSGDFETFSKQSGTTTDDLTFYNNVRPGGSLSGPVKLTYLSYGTWSHDDSSTGEHRDTYFLFGFPTVPSDMPHSGLATYTTAVTGNLVSIFASQGESNIGGSATFTADFGAGTVNTELTLQTSAQNVIGTYLGTSQIAGNSFGNPLTAKDDAYFNFGSFAGGFYGPGAKEMGYAFTVDRGLDDPYGGASVAPGHSWIMGTVVGTKTGN